MNIPLVEACSLDLYADIEYLQEKYTPAVTQSILRIRDMHQWIIAKPSAKDADFVREDCSRHKVSRPTAYADLSVIKTLLPKLSQTSRDFNFWRFIEMILETYNIAKLKKDVRTMERAVATFGRYTGLDREEKETISFEDLIPQPFTPSDDPSVLGFNRIPNVRSVVKKLIKKYSADVPDIVDIEHEEVDIMLPPKKDDQ